MHRSKCADKLINEQRIVERRSKIKKDEMKEKDLVWHLHSLKLAQWGNFVPILVRYKTIWL